MARIAARLTATAPARAQVGTANFAKSNVTAAAWAACVACCVTGIAAEIARSKCPVAESLADGDGRTAQPAAHALGRIAEPLAGCLGRAAKCAARALRRTTESHASVDHALI